MTPAQINQLPIIKFDTETRCDLSLPDVGRHRYLRHASANLLMVGHKAPGQKTQLWLPGMPVPFYFEHPEQFRFAAFNAAFDQMVSWTVGRRHGFKEIPLSHCVDIMGVAARYGLPQSLDGLGKALHVEFSKIAQGKVLVKKICTPPHKYTKEEWQEFCDYCVRDVDSMSECMTKMPSDTLSADEQAIWYDTALINSSGVPVDSWSVKQINKIVDYYTQKQASRIPAITKGEIHTIDQGKAIIAWAATMGVTLKNFQKGTVDKAVNDLEMRCQEASLYPGEDIGADYVRVLDLLKIRQLIGGAAVKKFKRLANMTLDRVIYDNLRYHGAGTGRVTGGGFQMLNLPRDKVKADKDNGETYDEAVEKVLRTFFNVSVLKHRSPLGQAKKLVRPMLKAPDGHRLVVADWGSIEYILLMYFAGEWDKVRAFRDGKDPYITQAMSLFHVDYDDVTDDQRQRAKPVVLGGGYMLSWGGLIGYAEGYGVDMSDDEAQFATNTFRSDHPRVRESWYALKGAAHAAVASPGGTFVPDIDHGRHPLKTSFQVVKDRTGRPWLVLTLPSGRNLFYCEPRLVAGKYGPVIKHKGINPDTKQWSWVYLKPQRIIENIIQALGRDILQDAMPRLRAANFSPRFSVYDEIGCLEPAKGSQRRLQEMIYLMCIPPTWMPKLPLKADGYVSQCYMKG